jgi:hypothetical protein
MQGLVVLVVLSVQVVVLVVTVHLYVDSSVSETTSILDSSGMALLLPSGFE